MSDIDVDHPHRGQDVVMRVVMSFIGGWGHAAPLLPVARWATSLGHHVSFAGQAAQRDRLVRMGHEFDVVGPETLATTSGWSSATR